MSAPVIPVPLISRAGGKGSQGLSARWLLAEPWANNLEAALLAGATSLLDVCNRAAM